MFSKYDTPVELKVSDLRRVKACKTEIKRFKKFFGRKLVIEDVRHAKLLGARYRVFFDYGWAVFALLGNRYRIRLDQEVAEECIIWKKKYGISAPPEIRDRIFGHKFGEMMYLKLLDQKQAAAEEKDRKNWGWGS